VTVARDVLSVVLGALFAIGLGVLVVRLLRSLRSGFSIRMQVFLALAGAAFGLAMSFIVLLLSPEELAAAQPSDASLRIGFSVLLLAVVAAVAAIFIGHLVAEPLERLTRAAQRIAAGERQASLPVPRGREVRELTLAFEFMRAKLEERHMLETFVADLSHELKNPIAAIRASSEVLFDALERDPERARHFLERIDEAALRLDHLTADLLTLARLEARGQARSAVRLDLRGVLDKAVLTLRAVAQAREITISTQVAEAAMVNGEAPALQRALENLLRNACNYAPAGSTVEVRIERGSRELALLVIDRGPGVDPAIAARVFERFTTTRQREGGTGLGLAIVRAVAESHGGRAELRPSTGVGTTFALVVPTALFFMNSCSWLNGSFIWVRHDG
jgi:two-component system, OmpR family, sensor histidine kinase CreC